MKPMPRQHHSRPAPTRHSAEPDASGARRPCVMPSSKACPGHCQSKPISPAFPALTSLGSGAAIQRCNRLLKPPPGPPTTVPAPSYVQAPAFQPRPMADGGDFRCHRSCRLGSLIGIGWKGTRIPAYLAKHLCCFDAAERMWRLRQSKIYRRYPSVSVIE